MPRWPKKRTALKPKPVRLAQVPTLHDQFEQTKPLCDGQQRGFQCVHYQLEVTPRLQESRDSGKQERTGFYARDRTCDMPTPSAPVQALDRDLRVYCNSYAPSKRAYNHEVEEGDIAPRKAAPASLPAPLDPAAAIAGALAMADAGIPTAIASGRPMIAEGGEPPRETVFNGPPIDSTVTIKGVDFIVHAWHHNDRGWLAHLPKLGVSGIGATRDAAEVDAVANAERVLPPTVNGSVTPAPDALY